MIPIITRRAALLGAATLAATRTSAASADTLRIGYQKNGSFVILRRQRTLETRFAPPRHRRAMDRIPRRPPHAGSPERWSDRYRLHR